MDQQKISFSVPTPVGNEARYLSEVATQSQLAGGGPFTQKCEAWLQEHLKTKKAILTPSCTSALEMAVILLDIQPGDEVIVPSYTFVSVANAVVLRGGIPVIVDIDPDTKNIDPTCVERACTPATKAVIIVHYGGVACDMERLEEICRNRGITLIEDAAHAIMADHKGRPLGSIGDLGCLSFHHTKNISCGEGGALLVNRDDLVDRAHIVRDKGTDRQAFLNKKVDKYSWVDVGSSFLLGEIPAAYLLAQLEKAEDVTERRLAIAREFDKQLADLPDMIRRGPGFAPGTDSGNGHLYYLMMPDEDQRRQLLGALASAGIEATPHYVPLHQAKAAKRFARWDGPLPVSESTASTIVRLPLHLGLTESDIRRIAVEVRAYFGT